MVLDKIWKSVVKDSDRLAISSRGYESLSYGNLWALSSALSTFINSIKGGDKKPFVVFGHKSPLMVATFLGIAKSGCAYVPVDVSMAEGRIKDIVEMVGNPYVLSVEGSLPALEGFRVIEVADLVKDKAFQDNLLAKAEEYVKEALRLEKTGVQDSLGNERTLWTKDKEDFYIIFTSGSTGKPKGVRISERALDNYTNWSVNLAYPDSDKDRAVFLNQAPWSFDLSVMDTYTALCSGGSIVTVDKKLQQDGEKLVSYIKDSKVNYFVSTPSFCQMCCSSEMFNGDEISSLRAFLFCGERLSKELAKTLLERFPQAKVINTYGPTESTVALTEVDINREMIEAESELPIGRVRQGSTIIVLGEDGEVKEDGESGELYIGGDTLSSGYFMDEEKTEAAFVKKNILGRDQIYYKTGDEGYYKGDMLYYVGRLDLQIKFHGYRIELGDIESRLVELPYIKEAAVLGKEKDGAIKMLVAFVSSDSLEGNFEDRKKIRKGLGEVLPDYMVPKSIKFVDRMPMTPNGKVDRKALTELL